MLLLNKPLVEARSLSWLPASQTEAEPQPLLVELSFAVAAGERVLLVGPSGSGKSTLLRAIANVLQQTESGVFGGELFVRGRCGLVLQDSANSFVAANLGGELAFGPENLALPEAVIKHRVDALLESVQLPYGVHRSTVELSGGESQRMQLAAVLALEPEVLLLDEPLSMLDPISKANVQGVIQAALADRPETAAIIVDHDASAWKGVVSRVLEIRSDGCLVQDVSLEQFLVESTARDLGLSQAQNFDVGYRASEGAGSITAFVGPSGAGKTTELQKILADLSASEVGYVPQQPEFTIAGNTVWQSATATVKNLGIETALAARLLKELGLYEKREQNPYQLSGGELRRLALASALAHHPRFLILDEPTVGQDSETWQAVAGVVLAARDAGVQVVVATHDDALIALADEVVEVVPQPSAATAEPRVGRVAPLLALFATLGFVAASFAITNVIVGLASVVLELLLTLLCLKLLPQQKPKRFVPILIALASIWLTNSLFAAGGLSPESMEHACVIALRVAFFVFPSLVLSGALRPVELAASLVRWLRVPARPAVAAAAALVRLELISWHWAAVRSARKLRGFSEGRGPVARTREFASSLFALLVQSLRSAGELAVAMQARAFGEPTAKRRTWVRF